jgi:hypothetical protein
VSHQVLVPATYVAALGCGIMAGLLFAFSSAVMPALKLLPAPEGTRAMQAINVASHGIAPCSRIVHRAPTLGFNLAHSVAHFEVALRAGDDLSVCWMIRRLDADDL